MDIRLIVSPSMTDAEEDNIVRVSEEELKKSNTTYGGKGLLRLKSGEKKEFLVLPLADGDKSLPGTARLSKKSLESISGKNLKPTSSFTLGCDPEFVFLTDRKKTCPANLWLPYYGKIGNDGVLAEFRPDPAEHEDGVIDNLRKLIKQVPEMVGKRFGNPNRLTPEAHSEYENNALGFHVHIGAPKKLIVGPSPDGGFDFIRSFIGALDYFVGIPAMLLENTNLRRLGNGPYGKPGDFRLSHKTIEYRTPGGFHLRHPDYARGIMGLAICVGKEILGEAEVLSNFWRDLGGLKQFSRIQAKYGLPDRQAIRKIILEPSKREAVKQIPNIIERLKRMENYGAHNKSINNYFNLVRENRQFNSRILENW